MTAEAITQPHAMSAAIRQAYAKLPAQDIERARAFYAEKLGLAPYGERRGHLYYRAGNANFILFPSMGEPSGTHDQLGLVVENPSRRTSGSQPRHRARSPVRTTGSDEPAAVSARRFRFEPTEQERPRVRDSIAPARQVVDRAPTRRPKQPCARG
jgi:catechol 2,3-dioxygenase-like lactoylglutathione lyase family enzyme